MEIGDGTKRLAKLGRAKSQSRSSGVRLSNARLLRQKVRSTGQRRRRAGQHGNTEAELAGGCAVGAHCRPMDDAGAEAFSRGRARSLRWVQIGRLTCSISRASDRQRGRTAARREQADEVLAREDAVRAVRGWSPRMFCAGESKGRRRDGLQAGSGRISKARTTTETERAHRTPGRWAVDGGRRTVEYLAVEPCRHCPTTRF